MSAGGVDLAGKVVVVAGATGAAGPSLVAALAAAGAHVVAVGRDQDRLDAVVDHAIDAAGAFGPPAGASGRAEAAVVDLLDGAAVRSWAERLVAEHGRVDGLFHLVGGWRGGTGIAESDPADWDRLQESLVVTLQHATRALHDPLVASGGRLAIVSTPQAQAPTATNAAYAAAKAAAEAWVLAVADSFGRADTGAAATIVQVKALVTDAMRQARPDRRFPGYTHVDDLAARLVGLFDTPAAELSGRRESLVP